MFNVNTKDLARRKWRLLIINSHRSHITRAFLKYCYLYKILVAIFPPHSTYTLQPLDVVLFKPLSTQYSHQLTQRLYSSKSLLLVKEGGFFNLFWQAWLNSFTENNILKAFKATGNLPLRRDKILDRFTPKEAEAPGSPATLLQQLEGADCREIMRQFDRVVKDKRLGEANALRQVIHHLAIQNELLHHENEGLIEALKVKKKQDKKSNALDLVKHNLNNWGGARWYSPQSFGEARTRERIMKETHHKEELEKGEDEGAC